ncbi:Fucose permease [Mucilaginibacter sp. OK268]|uniref:MFS transporter n=1 Tax=Mucilaginibacter sp. OK268 TaxID=1881048 RepID=UPI00088D6929|nr:MFS transporter [Mucilaginibacter sp. OK268]SDP91063.1 Fucose permease [Mucilaginibacter sp. OK268]
MDQVTAPGKLKLRIACGVFFFISGFGYSSWASRIPSIQQQLHLNEGQLGAVLFALPIGLMLTIPITAKMLKHFSSRSIMLVGAIAFNLLLCLPGFAAYIWQLVVLLFFFGSARNIFNLSVNAQAVSVQSFYDRSIMVTFHGIWSMAGFAGAAVGYLMVSFNVAPSYHLLFVGISMIIITLIFYPHAYYEKPVNKINRSVFTLPDKHLIKFSLICFASMACENTMYDWSGIYFQKVLHASKPAATAAFVVYMVAMTIGRFTGDRLVASAGIKKVLSFSGILILTGLLFSVLLPYNYTVYVGYAMVGMGVSCVVPLVFSMAGKSQSMNTGQALAAISTVGYLGFLIIPPAVGFIAQAAGLRWAFGIVAGFGALIIVMVSKLKPQTEAVATSLD